MMCNLQVVQLYNLKVVKLHEIQIKLTMLFKQKKEDKNSNILEDDDY